MKRLLVATGSVLVALSATGGASASPGDTMSIAFSPTPIQGRQFEVSATGVSDDPASLVDATYKPAAGGTCAATFQDDTGQHVNPDENSSGTGTGSYDVQMSGPLFLGPGSYLFCGWMYDQADLSVLATTQTVLTVPALHSSLQLHVPAAVPQGQGFTASLDVTLDADVPVTAWADVLANSPAGCPRTPLGEPRSADNVIDEDIQDHAQPSGTVTVKSEYIAPRGSGNQLVCAWLLDNWSVNVNPQPVVAGPVSAVVTVAHRLLFKGHTSQGFGITVGAAPFAAQILGVGFRERLRCGARTSIQKVILSADAFGVVRPDSSGRFAITERGDGRTTKLRARITGKTMTGTLSDSGAFTHFVGVQSQRVHCTAGRVRFTARAK